MAVEFRHDGSLRGAVAYRLAKKDDIRRTYPDAIQPLPAAQWRTKWSPEFLRTSHVWEPIRQTKKGAISFRKVRSALKAASAEVFGLSDSGLPDSSMVNSPNVPVATIRWTLR